jgi:Domain of unknown function (DUF6429)
MLAPPGSCVSIASSTRFHKETPGQVLRNGIIANWPEPHQSSDCGMLSAWGCRMDVNEEKIDDMVLALLYLTTFQDKPRLRAWKGHDWEALNRLHRKDYISDPATKAKSVLLTEAGAERSKRLFEKYFAK